MAEARLHRFELLRRGWFVGGRTGFGDQAAFGQWRTENLGAGGGVAGGGAVINERVSLLGGEEGSDIRLADFEFERGGHAVESLQALTLKILAVLMEIDEPGSDDEAACGDRAFAG